MSASPEDGVELEQREPECRCDHCGVEERFNVLCPDCEELVCLGCGRVECCCAEAGPYPAGEVTSVEECAHGEHPMECSLCTSAGLHAAVSGEGEDMGDTNDVGETIKRMDEWIAGASVKELRAATYAIDREIARRKAENDQERKELEQFEKPVRKTRSDAGTTRRKVEAA